MVSIGPLFFPCLRSLKRLHQSKYDARSWALFLGRCFDSCGFFAQVPSEAFVYLGSICGRVVKAPDSSSGQLCWDVLSFLLGCFLLSFLKWAIPYLNVEKELHQQQIYYHCIGCYQSELNTSTPPAESLADYDFSNFLVLSLSDANTSERVCGVQAKIHTRGSTSLLRRQLEKGKSNKFSELWHQK